MLQTKLPCSSYYYALDCTPGHTLVQSEKKNKEMLVRYCFKKGAECKIAQEK